LLSAGGLAFYGGPDTGSQFRPASEMRLSGVLRCLLLATALNMGCAFGVSDSPGVNKQENNSTKEMRLTQALSPISDNPSAAARVPSCERSLGSRRA
jgi:hypothetical protein